MIKTKKGILILGKGPTQGLEHTLTNLTGKLADECSEHIDENKMIYIDYGNMCGSCTWYIVLLAIFFITSISIKSFLIDFLWQLKSDTNIASINSRTETVIY